MLRGKSDIAALDLHAFVTRSNQLLSSTGLWPMVPLVDEAVVAAEEPEEVQLAAYLVVVVLVVAAPLLLRTLLLAVQQHRRRSPKAGSL